MLPSPPSPTQLSQAGLPTLRLTLKSALRHVPGGVWLLLDYTIASLAVLLALFILPERIDFINAALDHGFAPVWYLLSFALITLTLAHILGLHDPRLTRNELKLAVSLLIATALTHILLTTATSVLFSFSLGQKVLLLSCILAGSGIYLSRLLYWRLTDEHVHRVCLIGDRDFLDEVSPGLSASSPSLILRHLALDRSTFTSEDLASSCAQDGPSRSEYSPFPGDTTLKGWILQNEFDQIVTQSSLHPQVMSPLVSCLDHGVNVFSYPQFVENHLYRVPVRQLQSEWFLHSTLLGLEPHYRIAKRLTDIGIATAGLILAFPIVALAALAIRLTSRGPIFYSQTRVGQYNLPFRIHKLRTMTVNAESAGAQWAKQSDPRVTPVGKFLRKTRIDELPQFWNILKGDMAFIGPRPERPEFTRELAETIPFYEKRHLLKPGLTGWAQINYPYGASVADALHKLEYDLYYIKHGSLQLDLHILVRTIGTVMKGAR